MSTAAHIVIIEKEWMEAEMMVNELHKRFPNSKITAFVMLAEFLLAYRGLPAIDLLITEDRFSLMRPDPNSEAIHAKLLTLFPDIVNDWEAKSVERLIRHLRKEGLTMPVIIYTHSEREWIAEAVFSLPSVEFCEKESSLRKITDLIRQTLPVRG